jgi:hypothetical protein
MELLLRRHPRIQASVANRRLANPPGLHGTKPRSMVRNTIRPGNEGSPMLGRRTAVVAFMILGLALAPGAAVFAGHISSDCVAPPDWTWEGTDAVDIRSDNQGVENVWHGRGGNDSLDSATLSDYVCGGLGNDTLQMGPGPEDTGMGMNGDDTINGEDGIDWLWGGVDADDINGGAAADHLFGEAGNDVVRGGINADDIAGQDGADDGFGNDGDDRLFGHDATTT